MRYEIYFILFHFTLKIIWSYLFFNYPTLEDTHRIFSFMHSLKTKDIYIYQLDVSYHGALISSLFYYPFVKLFGSDIMVFRTANCILSSLSLFIGLKLMSDNIKKTVFFLLFTFTPLFLQRNSLFAGNYAFIPILTILILKTEGFPKGFFLGLSIQNNILSALLILFLPERKIKEFLLGLVIGISPAVIFNFYNFLHSGAIPTIEDIKLRPLKLPEFYQITKLLLISAPLIPSVVSSKYALPSAVILLFTSSEERYYLYTWTIMIIMASENYSQKNFLKILPIFCIVYFISNIPETMKNKDYIMYPYGPKHYVVDKREIQERFECIIKEIKGEKIEMIRGDLISTDFIKFYLPEVDIYYTFNPWSYFIPIEFKQEPEHIVVYIEENKECQFRLLKYKEREKTDRKIYFRETGIKSIISHSLKQMLHLIDLKVKQLIRHLL